MIMVVYCKFIDFIISINEPGYGKKGHNYRIEDGNGVKWVTKKQKKYFEEYNQAVWDADHNNFY